jgi:hypothetical protein
MTKLMQENIHSAIDASQSNLDVWTRELESRGMRTVHGARLDRDGVKQAATALYAIAPPEERAQCTLPEAIAEAHRYFFE